MASGGIFAQKDLLEQFWDFKTGNPKEGNEGRLLEPMFKEYMEAVKEREKFKKEMKKDGYEVYF